MPCFRTAFSIGPLAARLPEPRSVEPDGSIIKQEMFP